MLERPPCRLRLYIYSGFESGLHDRRYSTSQAPDFHRSHNRRAFTSEVPVYHRLVSACRVVQDPASADAFLVPALLGTAIAAGWDSSNHVLGGRSAAAAALRSAP